MNPELQRQLWLNFSLTRWLVMPALLITAALTIALNSDDPAHSLAVAGAVAFVLLVGVMGAHAVGNSVQEEVNEDTWDHQRMSAMQPWTMTWGKLAGASAFAWYGGALCLLIAIPSSLTDEVPRSLTTPVAVAIGVLVCLLLQASLLAINLQILQIGNRLSKRSNALLLVPLLFVALYLAFKIPMLLLVDGRTEVRWWSINFPSINFFVASLVFFLICALVTAWRAMAQVLAVRQLPWGWPLLGLIVTGYLAGFVKMTGAPGVGMIGLSVCLTMTYIALMSESQSRPIWQRVSERIQRGRWREALLLLPLWPTTWVLGALFALLLLLSGIGATAHPAWPLATPLFALSAVLLVFRDCCIAMFFAFARNNRRSRLAFVLTMVVLYGLLPWLSMAASSPVVRAMALPLATNEAGLWSLAVALIHAAVAVASLRWQWRQMPTTTTAK